MKDKLSSLFSLKDKVIVITGAIGLLGKKHAEAIAAYGGTPVLLDLSQYSIDEYVNELNCKYGVQSSGFVVDITDEKQIKQNSEHLIEKYGKIDGLVNNAANNPKQESKGIKNNDRLENFNIDKWDLDLDVALKGSFLCIKHFGFKISQNPSGGSIVNISSDLGLIAPDQSIYKVEGLDDNDQPVKPITYSIVKTGIIGMTRYVATYWANKGVRCNTLCPGGVENDQDKDFIKKLKNKIPMNRMAKKDEYKGSIIYLLSDASSYVNGATLAADGGRSVW